MLQNEASSGLEPETPPYQETVIGGEGWNRDAAASVLQASRFRGDVTVFRLNARPPPKTGSDPAFRRNEAERVYIIEAAHNPEVAGSNPAPATGKAYVCVPFLYALIAGRATKHYPMWPL